MRRWILMAMLTLVVAACGGDADSAADTAADAADAAADATSGEAVDAGAADGGSSLGVGSSDLGDFLVDGDGVTLYLFVPDESGEPTCYEDCASKWPPLTAEVGAGAGVDAGLIGSVERTDGSTQVTYNGWPLYYFAGDSAAGDTNGQGVGENWFVISPAGDTVR